MLPGLDIWSVIVAVTIARLTMVAGLAFYASQQKTYPGFLHWVAGAGAGVLTTLFLALRPLSPGSGVILINLVLGLHLVLAVDGTRRFVQLPPLDRRWYALAPFNALVGAVAYFPRDLLLVRIWWISLLVCSSSAAIAWACLRHGPAEARPMYRLGALLHVAYGTLMVVRALFWTSLAVTPTLLGAGPVEAFFFLCMDALDVGIMVFFLMANGQRLEADLRASTAEAQDTLAQLQESMAQVKILSGILPICSRCKKIRDGEGRWSAVEDYVRQRTDAQFSHGVCPQCFAVLYPEHADLVQGPEADP